MRKTVQAFYIAIFTAAILLPVPLFKVIKPYIDTNNYENRELAPRPALQLNAESISSFPSDFDSWMSDHLPFRNQLLSLNGMIDYDVLHSSSSDTVIVGRKGWLFYKGAQVNSEDPVADYTGTNLFSEEQLETIARNMKEAQQLLKDRGSDFVIFIAPNKERVYSEYMPRSYGAPAKENRLSQVTSYLRVHTDIPVVSCMDDLMEYKKTHPDTPVYFKYDTHWNDLGAYIGTRALAQTLGYSMPDPDEVTMTDLKTGDFDLARMLHLSRELDTDHVYKLTGYSNHTIISEKSEDGRQYRFYNPANDGEHKKLVIVGDSFSMLLSPYAASIYNNTFTTYYYDYQYGMLDQESPNIVVYETVERYLGNMLNFSLVDGIGKE